MAMKNYRVEYEDGSVSYFQFDDAEDAGKAGLEAMKDAEKNAESPVKKVTQTDPKPADIPGDNVQDA